MVEPGIDSHNGRWKSFLKECSARAASTDPLQVTGHLTKVAGLVVEAVGLQLPVGSDCTILLPDGKSVDAEIVGFSGNKLFMMPTQDVQGLVPGAKVVAAEVSPQKPRLGAPSTLKRRIQDHTKQVPVGNCLLGRVLDANGRPLDSLGPLHDVQNATLQNRPYNPLNREPISHPLDVGIRAINALMTVGRGQRMGLFAGSGVGKSVLLGMMARYTSAEIIVVGLIGERGREVKEFIEQILGAEGLARSVVIAAPADTSPLLRLQGAAYATTVAEYFRNQGKHVLLIMDSLTRFAMAQREIALAIGEPPATKGYPPSVFAKLPQLVERAGNGPKDGGSITAFYTVLTEGDDQQDPIADSARAILDGHIVLSRSLADQGHYPAIDIEASISRAFTSLVSMEQIELVRRFKQYYSRYHRNRDLINVGAYVQGTDPELDRAIQLHPKFEDFLQQKMLEKEGYLESINKLAAVLQQ